MLALWKVVIKKTKSTTTTKYFYCNNDIFWPNELVARAFLLFYFIFFSFYFLYLSLYYISLVEFNFEA
jgi:hypothetical protein